MHVFFYYLLLYNFKIQKIICFVLHDTFQVQILPQFKHLKGAESWPQNFSSIKWPALFLDNLELACLCNLMEMLIK